MSAAPTGSGAAQESSPADGMRLIYWIIGAIAVLLAILGLITYSSNKSTQEAQDKAQQLTQAFQQAGLPVPQDQDILVRTLGTDGGAVCDNPARALGKAALIDSVTNGADFVGRRPVIIDRRVLQGEALILQVYCPDKLQEYRDKIDEFKSDNTLKF